MPNPALTSVGVVNMALEQIASQSQIVSLSGTSPEQIAASALYTQVVELVLRSLEPEFSRREATLSASGTPVLGWANSYSYPADCLGVRQVVPASINTNDPQPIRWSVVTTGTALFINTNQASASVFYVTSAAGVGAEGIWDSIFTEAVVRTLASELAMAIAGRPDFSKQMLTDAGQIMAADIGRDS